MERFLTFALILISAGIQAEENYFERLPADLRDAFYNANDAGQPVINRQLPSEFSGLPIPDTLTFVAAYRRPAIGRVGAAYTFTDNMGLIALNDALLNAGWSVPYRPPKGPGFHSTDDAIGSFFCREPLQLNPVIEQRQSGTYLMLWLIKRACQFEIEQSRQFVRVRGSHIEDVGLPAFFPTLILPLGVAFTGEQWQIAATQAKATVLLKPPADDSEIHQVIADQLHSQGWREVRAATEQETTPNRSYWQKALENGTLLRGTLAVKPGSSTGTYFQIDHERLR